MSATMSFVLKLKGPKVFSVEESASVKSALAELDTHGVGALLVYTKEKSVAGIITERDIIRALARTAEDIRFHSVAHHMTHREKLIIATPDDTIEYAMSIMTNNHIRHLPVMDKSGTVYGMVSIGDIVKASLSETSFENRMLKEYIEAKYPQ